MTKFEKKEKLLKRVTQKVFKDTLRHLGISENPRITKVVSDLLSLDEHEKADCLPAVIAGSKVIVICEDPEPIKEALLIDEDNPGKVYRMDLTLKRKKKAAKA